MPPLANTRTLVFGAFLALVTATSFWHHVRIQQFVQLVHQLLEQLLPAALRGGDAETATSLLRLKSDLTGTAYQLQIRHKARLIELSAEISGGKEERRAASEFLGGRLAELKKTVSPRIELEAPARRKTRLLDVILLNPDLGTPLSRSLTDDQAAATAAQIARLMTAVESLMRESRG